MSLYLFTSWGPGAKPLVDFFGVFRRAGRADGSDFRQVRYLSSISTNPNAPLGACRLVAARAPFF